MAEKERLSRISIRGDIVEFPLDDRDEYHLTTSNGEDLSVYLGGIDSNPNADREIILVSPAIAGRSDTGKERNTVDGVRSIYLSRKGKGSQPLPQPEGGAVEVDLGIDLLQQRQAVLHIEKDGTRFNVQATVFLSDSRFEKTIQS